MSEKEENVIIIKKINAGHHGHHGGAWKVAYADFVTAMMAFFLLMWLLNAVPSEKLQGVAQYFEPTIGVRDSKGIGFEGGKGFESEGAQSHDRTRGVTYGVLRKGEIVDIPQQGDQISVEEVENRRFQLVEGELNKVLIQDQSMQSFASNVNVSIRPEGLVIQIQDQDKIPMFTPGSEELQSYARNILLNIIKLIRNIPNYLAIDGYTDKAVNDVQEKYGNWELSADRANAVRRFLVQNGIPIEQIARVTGRADTKPLNAENPYDPINRRFTITLLRNSIVPDYKISMPNDGL